MIKTPVHPWRGIALDAKRQTVTIAHGKRFEQGGFTKGWCAEMTAQRLQSYCPILMNACGDIANSASQRKQSWPVAIENIDEEAPDLALFALRTCGIATTGSGYRHWQRETNAMHHIIDARKGLPTTTGLLRATVNANTPVPAEVPAKLMIVLGNEHGSSWVDVHGMEAYIILDNAEQRKTSTLERYLRK